MALEKSKIRGNQCHNDILLSGRGCNLIWFLYRKKDWAEVCNMIWRTAYMHMAVFVAQATHCQPCFNVHIMAATNPLGEHGGKRDNSGRKKEVRRFF